MLNKGPRTVKEGNMRVIKYQLMDSKISVFKIKDTVELLIMALHKETHQWELQRKISLVILQDSHQMAQLQLKVSLHQWKTVEMFHHQPTKVDALISRKVPISLHCSATELKNTTTFLKKIIK